MRIETTERTLYTVAELQELHPDGFDRALEAYGIDQWESGWAAESISEVIEHSIGIAIGVPKADEYGQSDFPGIPGVALGGWDLERGQRIELSGTLYKDDAPALPWPEDCDRLRLGYDERRWTGNERGLWIEDSYPEWMADSDRGDVRAFWARWDEIIQATLTLAMEESEYLCGAENFIESAECNGWEFTEDGQLY